MNIEQLMDQADSLVRTQQHQAAIDIYSKIIDANELYDEAYLYRGEQYSHLKQFDKAIADILEAVRLDDQYFEAYMSLSTIYETKGETESAIEACKQASFLKPNNAAINAQLAKLYNMVADKLLSTHQPVKAMQYFQQASLSVPDNLFYKYKYAYAVSKTGEFETAINIVNDILLKEPSNVATRSLLIEIYEKTGEIDKGWQEVCLLSDTYPDSAYIGLVYGKYALRNNQQSLAISKLIALLSLSELKNDDELSLNMLLGKLYDSISEYDNAFNHFERANRLKFNDYDYCVFEEQVSNIINVLSKENFNAIPTAKDNASNIIFILGMPRSGTSLIEQMISSHSSVFGAGELHIMPTMTQTISKSKGGIEFPEILTNLTQDEINGYANELQQSYAVLSSKKIRVTDKLPHNFLFIALIHKILPNAKIINCLRNPIDNCLSCYFQHFGGHHPYAYHLDSLRKYYRQYQRLMLHWEEVLEIPLLNVRYEELIDNPRQQVERLLKYLALDWEEGCLEFYKNKRSLNTASYAQVDKKLYSSAVERWRNYESHIAVLIDEFNDET